MNAVANFFMILPSNGTPRDILRTGKPSTIHLSGIVNYSPKALHLLHRKLTFARINKKLLLPEIAQCHNHMPPKPRERAILLIAVYILISCILYLAQCNLGRRHGYSGGISRFNLSLSFLINPWS